MKQVFYVHSGITWLMTLGVIQKNSFCNEDVLILFGRGFLVPCMFEYYVLDEAEQKLSSLPSYGSPGVFRCRTILKRLDKNLEQRFKQQDFILYLPTERNYLMQYLQTHPQCVGRNFIEEGLLTYHGSFIKKNSPSSFRSDLLYALRFPFHLNRTRIGKRQVGFLSDTFTVYVCTVTGVSMLSHFVVCKIDLTTVLDSFKSSLAEVKILFVFDPVVEKKICDSKTFLRSLEDFVRANLNSGEKIAIKFHPQQVSFTMYLNVFNSLQIPYQVVPQDVIPEVLLLKSSGLRVFGLSSSVLFYASEWGHYVRSFSSSLAAEIVSYDKWVRSSIPQFLIDKLRLL